MRALAGWVLAVSLAATPAFAAGSGGDSAGTSTSTNDNSNSTASAAAKTDASSLEAEIGDLRDLIDSQAKQMETQNEQLKLEQQKMQVLEEQLKAVTAAPSESAKPAVSNVSASAPTTSPVATATVAMPSVPAASSPAPAAAPADPQGEQPAPLFFRIGSATFTPLGFMDLTNVFRSPVIGSGIGTNFGSLPYRIAGNFPGSGLTEDRFSAQNSRLGIRVDANIAGGQAIGYLETDFLGNQAGTISISSNSYTLRMRVYFIDWTKGKIEILGGQDWSMLTPNRVGINPIPGNIFFSQDMDTNYQLGLVWERTPQFRFIYHASKAAAFGVSVENPDQYGGGGNGSGTIVTPSGFATSQLDEGGSSNGTNIPNLFPDLIVKAAFDPMVMNRDFHFEVSGLLNEFRVNTFSNNTSMNSTAVGGAISANTNLEIIKNFHFIANSFWSDGAGRDIFGQAPDLVIHPQANASSPFTVAPLHSGSFLTGAEWQVKPKLMVYGYYSGIYIGRDFFQCGTPGTGTPPVTVPTCGYGIPVDVPGGVSGVSQSTAYSQNRFMDEGTIGLIPVFWRSPNYGALQLITQYSYLSREPWAVVPGGLTPTRAHGSMAYVDLRYVLP